MRYVARMQALAVLSEQRCSAILRTVHAAAVRPAMDAAIEGGFARSR
jgi:hypothetical protein